MEPMTWKERVTGSRRFWLIPLALLFLGSILHRSEGLAQGARAGNRLSSQIRSVTLLRGGSDDALVHTERDVSIRDSEGTVRGRLDRYLVDDLDPLCVAKSLWFAG